MATITPNKPDYKNEDVAKKAQDVLHQAGDKARDAAGVVADGARNAAATIGQKAEDATGSVGQGLQSLAGTIRGHTPQSGVIGAAASSVATGLENTGKYLKDEGLSGMAEDITGMIRRNPIPALLLGVGVGFLIARATTSRS